ncbi:MAG: TolC family protein, partial [Planctomycetales bacterium]|nr:TolC family protein [Planctomycetales bacterium]
MDQTPGFPAVVAPIPIAPPPSESSEPSAGMEATPHDTSSADSSPAVSSPLADAALPSDNALPTASGARSVNALAIKSGRSDAEPITLTAWQRDRSTPPIDSVPRQLQVPPDLPGADASPLQPPPFRSSNDAQRREALESIYFPIPSELPDAQHALLDDPDAALTDLATLQSMALANSPALRMAAAEVESARGLALQAGVCPNPEVGYQADTINTSRTAGYHGIYVNQTFVTGGKLYLAQKAAEVDYCNAQLVLRRTRIEIATAVRRAYFAALIAREKLRIQTTLSQFVEAIYRTQIQLVEAGEAAAYEPLQMRVMVTQSRGAVLQAEQQFAAAKRSLAAAMGVPHMQLGALAGSPDMPIPAIDFESAKSMMLAQHTDVAISRNNILRARRLLELA